MALRLARTVILNGETVEAGTAQTAKLKGEITNPVAWVDDGEKPEKTPAKADNK